MSERNLPNHQRKGGLYHYYVRVEALLVGIVGQLVEEGPPQGRKVNHLEEEQGLQVEELGRGAEGRAGLL
jgi:hypothetical protein